MYLGLYLTVYSTSAPYSHFNYHKRCIILTRDSVMKENNSLALSLSLCCISVHRHIFRP